MLKNFWSKRNSENQYLKRTFSQSGEDVIVKFIFDAIGIPKPNFIDIGAHHPFYLNNTALLCENGSTGINIEPDPVLFSEFPKCRRNDLNLNIGISDIDGESDFFIINVPTLNTFSKKEAENYSAEGKYFIKEVKKIKTRTVNTIISEYSDNKFPEFLTLDAEGVDELVLTSIDYAHNFPIVICVETISFSTSGQGKKNEKIIDFLYKMGYFLYADTYINSIFIKKEYWR